MSEVYKTIEEYNNYEVSDHGNVINKKTGRILKPHKDIDGYYTVTLNSDVKKKSGKS